MFGDLKKVIGISLGVIIITGISSFGAYSFGYEKGFNETKKIVIEGLDNAATPENKKIDFSTFWQVWDALKSNHINGKTVKDQDLVYGAIKGLTNALDDPHTVFFTPDEAKKFNEDVKGNFGGIGAEIGKDHDQLIIVSPLKNSPAEKAGLKPKDKILKIDDLSTNNLSVDEAVSKIRGEVGTKVILTIFRDGLTTSKKIEIIRDLIHTQTLDWSIKDNNILYIQLYSFNTNSESLFEKAIIDAATKSPDTKGLILDLRNNPGGYFDVAVDLAGWFIKRGDVVVKERSANGDEQTFRANGNQALSTLPMVVLINSGSASASEILAGALKIDRGIKLIGEKSFGKGTVQELENIKDDSLLKITIANWLMPDGTLIDKNGINPDYEVELTDKDIEAKRDPQLDKAIEVLKAQFAK